MIDFLTKPLAFFPSSHLERLVRLGFFAHLSYMEQWLMSFQLRLRMLFTPIWVLWVLWHIASDLNFGWFVAGFAGWVMYGAPFELAFLLAAYVLGKPAQVVEIVGSRPSPGESKALFSGELSLERFYEIKSNKRGY